MDDDAAPDLRHYLAVIRQRRWLLIAVVGAVTVLAVAMSLIQNPVYAASSQILLESQQSVDPLATQSNNAPSAQRQLNNEIRQLTSNQARDAVAKEYKGPLSVSAVSASVASTDADVITIRAAGGDPSAVAKLVNTYVDVYLRFRTEQRVGDLLETGNAVRVKADDLRRRIADVSAPLTALDAQIASAAPGQQADLQRQREARVVELATELNPLQSQLAFYQQQLDKVELSAGIRQSGDLRLLAPAGVASTPISPKPMRNAVLGLVLGLMLGVGAAFAADYLDDSVRNKTVLEAVSGLPTLGLIPRIHAKKGEEIAEVVTLTASTSGPAEAYRTLRTSVKFLGLEGDCKVIQLTSPIAAEGKTLTAMNLSVALAQAGDRVIVVGCDLRRPRLDKISHAALGPGLTSVLVGDSELHDAIVRHDDVDLAILRTGPIPPDPSELLGSQRTAGLIQALRAAYDIVILDCPPLLPVSDSLILARYADATLMVVSEGKTSRRNLARALELLRQVDAPLKGTILNGTGGARGGYGYGYGYGGYGYGGYSYAYAQDDDDDDRRGPRLPGRRKRSKDVDADRVLVDG